MEEDEEVEGDTKVGIDFSFKSQKTKYEFKIPNMSIM